MMKKLLIPLAVALSCAACADYSGKKSIPKDPVQKAEGLSLYEVKDGTRTWNISAAEADIFDNSTKATMTSPVITLYENDKESTRIKGKTGTLDFNKKFIVLRDNVSAQSLKESTTLTTSLLNYDYANDRIFTDSGVTVTQQGAVMKGRHFEAKSDLSEIRIREQATTLPEQLEKKNENK